MRSNPTAAERRLWNLLRENFSGARFRRQVPIRFFIADFASHRLKLVIEVDGGQHCQQADAARTAIIEAEGYRVLRFWNNDVLQNADGVLSAIIEAVPEITPTQPSPIKGED